MKNRFVSILAVTGLCAVALVGSPAQAAVSPSATSAGSWLAGQLTSGLVQGTYGADYGLSIDVLFALQAADTQGAKQDAIVSAVRKNVKDYVGGPTFDTPKARYAGASAKLLVAAQDAEKDPTAFGEIVPDEKLDLVDLVEKSITDSGRVTDRDSNYGDFANLLGQAFALQGLAEAGSAKVTMVRDYLLGQQCGAGYFPLKFDACKSDTDVTALAIRAMSAAKADGVGGLDSALGKATAWLVKEQRRDGSFGGGESTPDSNANSTGIAANALAMRGETAAAEKAAAWIYNLQARASTGGKLADERGAVAYDKSSFDNGAASGITDSTADQWRRATAQAALGLIHLDPATIDSKVTESVSTKVPKPLVRTVTKSTTVVVNEPAPVPDKADSAAGRVGQFLAGAYSNGDHLEVKDGDDTFVDYDLTADSVLSLRQLGQQEAFAERATAFLLAEGSIDSYAHGAPYEKNASYAEALAKLVIAGSLAKKPDTKVLNPLIAELSGLQQKDGSFQDEGKYADESGSTKRQSIVAIALMMSGESESADRAVEHIAGGKCTDGSFPEELGAACDSGDPVATGWALQAVNAMTDGNRPATETLGEMPEGWGDDRAATVVNAATSLNGIVRVDGSVGDADLASIAAIASGRQAAGLDAGSTALYLAKLQKEDGGLPALPGDKESDVKSTVSSAPALGPASLLSAPGNGLTSALSMPINVDQAPATAPAAASTDGNDLTISRPVAYATGGVLAVLLLAILAWGLLGRRRGYAV